MRLTPREAQVASGLLRGLKREAIAQELAISIHTVDFHLRHLRAKAGASCALALVIVLARRPDVLRTYSMSQLMLPLNP